MAIKARISGRVQGVGYRAWTAVTARQLGLSGWVRNRTDGTVEALFSGTQEAILHMLEACMQGPPAARVTEIRQETIPDIPPDGFQALPTL